MMKKLLSLILCLTAFILLLPLSSCAKNEVLVLNVYNWEDYIACDEEVYDMVSEFEIWYSETYGKEIKVNYSTFGTNENMYNELKLTQKKDGSYSYDLVCPSEYMIQKMIIEGMCEEFDHNKMVNYNNNLAPYIKNLFIENDWYNYATCYNWGTMGFTYNPETVDYDDVKSWQVVTNPKYKNKITIKDSVRDSSVLGLGYLYRDQLLALKDDLNSNKITASEYNAEVFAYLNDFSASSVESLRKLLTDVRQNLYGFEVDSGKQDMATGKLWINFAWSGDAVYAMDIAEEVGTYLEYVVPEEGSNIFFDGWVMPKGANKELAQIFLEFMYREDNAIENLDYICYSSPMVGEDIFEYVCDNYGLTTLIESDEETDVYLNGKYYEEVYIKNDPNFASNLVQNGDLLTYSLTYLDDNGNIVTEDTEIFAYSVKHFFGNKIEGDGIVYTDTLNRQLVTMYPDEETMNRCVVMKHLTSDELKLLNNMWDSVKVGYMPYSTMLVILIAVIVILAIFITAYTFKKKGIVVRLPKKDYGKLIKSERIK